MAFIQAVQWGSVEAPLLTPFKTSVRSVDYLREVVLKIVSDDGRVGWGSAPATAKVTGTTEFGLHGALLEIAPHLIGLNVDRLDENLEVLSQSIMMNHSAKAAVDCALHDVWAQGLQVPLWKALGGYGGTVETDLTISVNSPEEMAQDAMKAVNRGFNILKTKVGLDPKEDLERLKAIQQVIDHHVKIRLDANQGWSVRQALMMLESIEKMGLNVEVVEQPIPSWDVEGLATVAQHSPFPIVADESCWSAQDALKLMEMAPLCPNIKFMKCGGLGEAKKIVALAQVFHRPVMIGSMLEGKICISAAVALAMRRGVCSILDLDGPALLAHDPVIGGAKFDGPFIHAWAENGLGVKGVKFNQEMGCVGSLER